VLLEMSLTYEVWYFVKDTPGVIGFVGTGQPAAIWSRDDSTYLPARPLDRRERQLQM